MKPWIDYIWVWTGCIITNDIGEILLMKRSINSKNQAGFWWLPGWAVDFWETFETATIRETREELNVDIEIIKLIELTDHIIKSEWQHWVSPTYLARIVSWELKNLESHKCDELKWFNINELPDKLTEPARWSIGKYRFTLLDK